MVGDEESNQVLGTVIFDPFYWLPIGIGIAGVAAGIIYSHVRSTKPKSRPTKTSERYFDYEKGELVLSEDYFVDNLDSKFFKKVSLFRTGDDDRYEIWGYENGVFEKKILPFLIEDVKKSSVREIKIKSLSTITDQNITSFKVVRYIDGCEMRDKVRKKEFQDRIEIINENSMEIRNYIFQIGKNESENLKHKKEISYTFPKDENWWGVIEQLPGKIGAYPGKLTIYY